MNTVCIFSHDCSKLSTAQISVQLTDMTDDHKTRRRSVPAHNMHTTCIHVVQWSAVLADPDIRLIVETPPVIVKMRQIGSIQRLVPLLTI